MDFGTALIPIISLVLGSVLTYLVGLLHDRRASRREDERESRIDAARRAEIGREHARNAFRSIGSAYDEIVKRSLDSASHDYDLGGLGLESAAREIDLIPDPLLRPRLTSVLSAVRFPHTLAGSSFSEGYPYQTQQRGLWLMRSALAAYLREEPTLSEVDELGKLAEANENAHQEYEEAVNEWETHERN